MLSMPSPPQSRAVRRAIAKSPATLRALARAAGVQPASLARIGTEEREASDAVATAVAKALRRWSRECAELAAGIEKASTREGRA